MKKYPGTQITDAVAHKEKELAWNEISNSLSAPSGITTHRKKGLYIKI